MPLIKEEIELLEHLCEIWNNYCKLTTLHPQDGREMCDAIHRAQHIIMKRSAIRDHPEIFIHEL